MARELKVWGWSVSCLLLAACGRLTQESALSNVSTKSATSEECRFLGDPYEPLVVLPKGQFKGRCADSTSSRSVIRKLDQFPTDADQLTVANVSHAGHFWIAKFPRYGVEDVIFQLEKFPAVVPAAHTQIRIRFREDSPVILTHQLDAKQKIQLRDFVISVEAIGHKGWSYDIFRGMKDEYLTAYRLTSLSDKYKHSVIKMKHEVIQWPLNLSEEEKQRVLPAYLELANANGMNSIYHTIYRNCTNELFKAMDSTLKYGGLSIIPIKMNVLDETYPVLVKSALDARGLIKYVDNPASYPANRPLDKTIHVPDRFDVRLPNLNEDPSVVIDP